MDQEQVNGQVKREPDSHLLVELQPVSIRHRLTTRLTAILVFLVVASTSAVGVWAIQTSRQTMEESIIASNLQLADQTAAQVQQFVDSIVGVLSLNSQMPGISQMDPWQHSQILQSTIANDRFYMLRALYTISIQGNEIGNTTGVSSGSWTEKIWFLQARLGALYVSPPFIRDQELLITIALPIQAYGEIVGVLGADVSLDSLQKMAEQTRVGEQGVIFVIAEGGQWLAHPNPDKRVKGEKSPDIQNLFAAGQYSSSYTDESGDKVLGVYSPVENVGWNVVVQQPLSEAYAPAARMTKQSIILVFLSIFVSVSVGWVFTVRTIRPLRDLVTGATAVGAGDLQHEILVKSRGEFGQVTAVFNQMVSNLRVSHAELERWGRELEGQVVERTADLEQRAAHLRAIVEISRAVVSILEPDYLIQRVVELIHEKFDFYHVGLFLLDSTERWVEYRAGAGQASKHIFEQGLRLEVNEHSMIGWCIANTRVYIAQDVSKDTVRIDHPLLPMTRSEAALPLTIRGRAAGVINIQSDQFGVFDQETIAVLQIMADQVAVALDNARLFSESEIALETAQRAYGEFSHQALTRLLQTRTDWGYCYARHSVTPVHGDWQPDMLRAAQTGQSVRGVDELTLAVPLRVYNRVIGALGFYKSAAGKAEQVEEMAFLETLAEQVSAALESAWLFYETQSRAARERMTGEVASSIRETLDVDTVLQTAVREMRKSLGLARVEVRLATTQELREDGR